MVQYEELNPGDPVLVKTISGRWENLDAQVFSVYDNGTMVALMKDGSEGSISICVARENVKLKF